MGKLYAKFALEFVASNDFNFFFNFFPTFLVPIPTVALRHHMRMHSRLLRSFSNSSVRAINSQIFEVQSFAAVTANAMQCNVPVLYCNAVLPHPNGALTLTLASNSCARFIPPRTRAVLKPSKFSLPLSFVDTLTTSPQINLST